MIKTYKQKNFVRDYNCTNVVFIQTNVEPDLNIWIEVSEDEVIDSKCEFLSSQEGTVNGVRTWINSYGYL